MSRPFSQTSPLTTRPGDSIRPRIESASADFPSPDSPTIPSFSARRRSKLTPRTACTGALPVRKCVCRSRTLRTTSSAGAPSGAGGSDFGSTAVDTSDTRAGSARRACSSRDVALADVGAHGLGVALGRRRRSRRRRRCAGGASTPFGISQPRRLAEATRCVPSASTWSTPFGRASPPPASPHGGVFVRSTADVT